MEKLYRMIGKSRQMFAQSESRILLRMTTNDEILTEVRNWRINHPKMGSRQTYYSLKAKGIKIPMGVNKFEQLLSSHGMTVGIAKKSGPKTSDGKGKRDYPNLTNGLKVNDINQLVVGDITYFWLEEKWHYIFTLKDVYSQRTISMIPARSMEATNAIRTLKELERLRSPERLKGCIFHSDNGSQYESGDYRKKLKNLGMKISRAQGCKQNGSAEQLNHIIKNMYIKHFGISTFKDFENACRKVKRLMNEERTIAQLGNRTVIDFESHISNVPLAEREIKVMHNFIKNT